MSKAVIYFLQFNIYKIEKICAKNLIAKIYADINQSKNI